MLKPLKSENLQLFLLRIGMGWLYLQGGIVKILDPNWTAAGFLNSRPEGNPFNAIWQALAGNPMIDITVAWGLTLLGVLLILGKFVKESSVGGFFLMTTFWAASLTGGLFQGLPIEHGWVVDYHMIYMLVFLYMAKIYPRAK